MGGGDLEIRCVPSHLGVEGNVRMDQLAERGRLSHPNNSQPLPQRPRVEPQWEALGLLEMSSDGSEAQDSGLSSGRVSMQSSGQGRRWRD